MQPLPQGYVVHYPKPQQNPHLFCDDIWIRPEDSQSEHEEVQRRCAVCGAVRVTVLPKTHAPYVEWRESSGLPWPVASMFGCGRGGKD